MARKPTYALRVRKHPTSAYVTAYLVRRAGRGGESGLMVGDLLPGVARALAEALGLEVVEEDSPWPVSEIPTPRKGCTPPSGQTESFGSEQ